MSRSIDDLFKVPSPIEPLDLSFFGIKKHEVWIKRDDLIHDVVSGNKWRKLKYNIQHFNKSHYKGILSFGGAHSNHVAALAYISHKLKIPTTFFIRGEEPLELSPTLINCRRYNIDLSFILRDQYRQMKTLLSEIEKKHPDHFIIPEGASNQFGLKGCGEIVREIEIEFDQIYCDVGTGATCAGIAKELNKDQQVIGVVVLKGADYIQDEIGKMLKNRFENFQLSHSYHFGGYAKKNIELIKFMQLFYDKTGVKTDPIYSGKMFYGLIKELRKNSLHKSKRIIALHSGGLQGIKGYEKRFNIKIY